MRSSVALTSLGRTGRLAGGPKRAVGRSVKLSRRPPSETAGMRRRARGPPARPRHPRYAGRPRGPRPRSPAPASSRARRRGRDRGCPGPRRRRRRAWRPGRRRRRPAGRRERRAQEGSHETALVQTGGGGATEPAVRVGPWRWTLSLGLVGGCAGGVVSSGRGHANRVGGHGRRDGLLRDGPRPPRRPRAMSQTCLRNGGDRYAGPGAAVDDQYSDAAGACQRLLDGGDVQVTVSPGAGGGRAGAARRRPRHRRGRRRPAPSSAPAPSAASAPPSGEHAPSAGAACRRLRRTAPAAVKARCR